MFYLNGLKQSCDRHVEGRLLLEYALAAEYDVRGDVAIIRESGGKPFLEDFPQIHFNISHCEGMVACALGEREVGIDVELLRPVRPKVLKRAFTERESLFVRESEAAELAFFRLWTLKESFVKAVGKGLAFGMKNAEFNFKGGDIISKFEGFTFRQYIVGGRFVLSVCEKDGGDSGAIKAGQLQMPLDEKILIF